MNLKKAIESFENFLVHDFSNFYTEFGRLRIVEQIMKKEQ